MRVVVAQLENLMPITFDGTLMRLLRNAMFPWRDKLVQWSLRFGFLGGLAARLFR